MYMEAHTFNIVHAFKTIFAEAKLDVTVTDNNLKQRSVPRGSVAFSIYIKKSVAFSMSNNFVHFIAVQGKMNGSYQHARSFYS